MFKRTFAFLFCFQLLACANSLPTAALRDARAPNSLGGLAQYCSKLLSSKDNKFNFEKFCAVREKFAAQAITASDFDGWREMSVEELMALIELHTQQTQLLTKGLELEKLNEAKMRRLAKAVQRLQKSEKNSFRRVREIVSAWYEITHSENLKLTLKKNPFTVEKFFLKIRTQNRLERLEEEMAARSAVEVFKNAGLVENATWWEKTKQFYGQPVKPPAGISFKEIYAVLPSLFFNQYTVQTALRVLVNVGTVMSGSPFLFFPNYDIETARKLGDEVENEVANGRGTNEAKNIVLSKNLKRNTISAYLRVVAEKANVVMFAALLAWLPYNHYVEAQAHKAEVVAAAAKVTAAMNTPLPTGTRAEQDSQMVEEMTATLVAAMEKQKGAKLSPAERARVRKGVVDAQSEVNSQASQPN